MRYLRFRLRTLFMLMTLVAGCLWLWRCGQLDAGGSYHYSDFELGQKDPNRFRGVYARAFRYELEITKSRATLSYVSSWLKNNAYEDSKIDYSEELIAVHPWTGRNYVAVKSTLPIVEINYGNPVGYAPVAPGPQALEALLAPYHLPRPLVDFLTGR